MSGSSHSTPPLLAVALALFALGIAAVVVVFVMLAFTGSAPGIWLYFASMLAPLGFVVALVFALRSGRRSR